jgi:hypothetical protein
LHWAQIDQLSEFEFPEANRAIVAEVQCRLR